MQEARRQPAGPVFDLAYQVLRGRHEYAGFQAGGSREAFCAFLDRISPDLVAAGLPAEDVHFAKRYPRNVRDFVKQSLTSLVAAKCIRACQYAEDVYEGICRGMQEYYSHGRFRTYIYPEEARLLYAVMEIEEPKAVAFVGSYYGYWAHAPLFAVAAVGGKAVLIDPDPEAQDVARGNLLRAGLASCADIAVCTGGEYLAGCSQVFDLVVLDAEGPRDHPDPRQRGKRIYEPLLEAIIPAMRSGALLVCHNILFQDIAAEPWFDRIIKRNHDELDPMMELVGREFNQFVELTSTEGVGAGRLRV